MPSVLRTVVEAFEESGVDLGALGLAWARAMPAVTIVPAFGLRALPLPARAVMALAIAASIFPAIAPGAPTAYPWALAGLLEIARGLPIAIAAAVPLWAATMAGGLVDTLRGTNDAVSGPTVEGKSTPLGVAFSLLACALFLAGGGPSRIASALATRPIAAHPVMAAAQDLASGISLAVAIAGPLLAAAIILEVAAALIARAASPAQVHTLLAPVRALALLGVTAIVLDRISAFVAVATARVP